MDRPTAHGRFPRGGARKAGGADGVRDSTLFRRLLGQTRPHWLAIGGLLVLGLLAAPLALLTPVPLRIVVDSAIGHAPLPGFLEPFVPAAFQHSRGSILAFAAVLVVVLALLTQLQMLLTTLLRTWTAERLVQGFRARLFQHVQQLSLLYHDAKGSSDAVYRIQQDAIAIQDIAVDGLIPAVSATVTLVSMFVVMMRLDWQLALVALGVTPIVFVLARIYRMRLRRRSREVKKLETEALGVVYEVLTALRVVKAFGQEERESDRFVTTSMRGVRERVRLAVAQGRLQLWVGLATAAGTAALLWLGASHVLSGRLTLGELLLVMSYLGQLYEPLKTTARKVASLQGQLASLERAFALLDLERDVRESPHARRLLRARGEIAFENVSFEYEPGRPVLRDLTLTIPAGTRVGLAGRTGVGKSTMLHLLSRFFDPKSGRILLDGVDLRAYRVADLRGQFAIVLQEPMLFSTSIGDNIAYARPLASREEVIEAARAANAHEFIQSLPAGYDTLVGERGMRLSGGERQRIALARAFLKDAPLLLLDEPTSAVDTRTEAGILEALERLMRGRTSFMVAHRLGTLRTCDLLIHFDDTGHARVSPGGPGMEPPAPPLGLVASPAKPSGPDGEPDPAGRGDTPEAHAGR
jgi:ATP-binding cassette subfamily B protein